MAFGSCPAAISHLQIGVHAIVRSSCTHDLSCAGVRPVPLEIHIMAFDIVSFDARLQAMARPTYSGLVQASSQVTVDFCASASCLFFIAF
jgi:hypothetical protein